MAKSKVSRNEVMMREQAGEILADGSGLGSRGSLPHLGYLSGFAAAIRMMESDETAAQLVKRLEKEWKANNFGEKWEAPEGSFEPPPVPGAPVP